jgi:hypothetical protein
MTHDARGRTQRQAQQTLLARVPKQAGCLMKQPRGDGGHWSVAPSSDRILRSQPSAGS